MAYKKRALSAPELVTSTPLPTNVHLLSRRDALAIELARAYLAYHGRIAPDVVKDSIVASANELASQLQWEDHL